MSTLNQQAHDFFEKYQSTFDSGNMSAFAKLFSEPFISVRPDGTIQSMPTNESASIFFHYVKENWQQEGYSSFATKDFDVTPIGASSMLVTLTWQMLDRDNNLIREWRQSYNLLLRNNLWTVITSTFHA